jgi:hypothetical protein
MVGTASSWRIAANILNKQPWKNYKGWSYSLGLGVGQPTPHRKKKFVKKKINEPRTWTDFLDKGPKQRNMDMIWYMEREEFV